MERQKASESFHQHTWECIDVTSVCTLYRLPQCLSQPFAVLIGRRLHGIRVSHYWSFACAREIDKRFYCSHHEKGVKQIRTQTQSLWHPLHLASCASSRLFISCVSTRNKNTRNRPFYINRKSFSCVERFPRRSSVSIFKENYLHPVVLLN